MNQDVDGNKLLFWEEVNEGKMESCSRIKDGNERLALGKDEIEGSERIILRIYII